MQYLSPIKKDPAKRNLKKYYLFHKDRGTIQMNIVLLKKYIKRLFNRGYL
jgi:hypothetical protein